MQSHLAGWFLRIGGAMDAFDDNSIEPSHLPRRLVNIDARTSTC
jgi:hypothetical protein